jgi:Ca2+-binding RTX toxin-like protein
MDIRGTSGNDTLQGGSGNDLVDALAGDDVVHAGDGNDGLMGGAGNDLLDGGAGLDFVTYYWSAAGVQVNLAAGTATGEGNDTLVGVEHVVGSGQADVIVGDAADNDLWGDFGNDNIAGGGGDDYISSGVGDDTLDGGAGFDIADYGDAAAVVVNLATGVASEGVNGTDTLLNIEAVYGSWYNDAIAGNAANNLFLGAPGNDAIDGGAGIDVARFIGTRSQFTVTRSGSDYQVSTAVTGEGTDTLTRIERLDFTDYDIALDLDGNAGSVAKVLGAVFGQGTGGVGAKAYAGIGLRYADAGMTYEQLMQLALEARLGPNASNEAVVNLLYTNVVGTAPDASTQAYYVSWITSGNYTQATLGMMAADYMGIPALAQNGLEFVA